MKKLTVLILFGLLIMAFGATAYAQQLEFRASGIVTTTALWYQNINTGGSTSTTVGWWDPPMQPVDQPLNPITPAGLRAAQIASGEFNRPKAYLVNRMNLVFDANIGKELTGRLALEIDAMRWGTFPTEDGSGRTARWRTDANGIEVKHAYMDAALPYFGIPVPMTVRVGIQPLGYRPHVLMITDGAGITAGININPVMIAPMWAKPLEGKDSVADDVDVYGLQGTVKVGTLSFGGYGLYFNMNTYPLNAGPPGFGITPGYAASYGGTPSYKADFWWAGGFVDGKVGPVNIQLDAVYDQGEVQKRHVYMGAAPARDVEYKGWMSRLKVEYPWEKFNFGAVGMYASGNDLHETDAVGLPGAAPLNSGHGPAYNPVTGQAMNTSRRVSSYMVPPGSEQAGGTGDDFFVFGNFVSLEAAPLNMAPATGVLTNVAHRGAYGGLWFLKAFAGFKVMPWYKVTVEALYLGDNTKGGNTFGNAVTMDGRLRDDHDIGWEFNIINEINIYKNLKWDIGAGYLLAGEAMEQRVVSSPGAAFGTTVFYNKNPINPWIVASKLRYTF